MLDVGPTDTLVVSSKIGVISRMTITIKNAAGYRVAEVKTIRANGLQGLGNYVLVVRLQLLIGTIRKPIRLSSLKIRVECPVQTGRCIVGFAENDGNSFVELTEYDSARDVFFLMPLSAAQVGALERYRGGGDLHLAVWLFGAVWQEDAGGARAESPIAEMAAFAVPQQEWLTALREMGFAKSLLFEVKLPNSGSQVSNGVSDLLATAWRHFSTAHYSEAVHTCRKVIECVENNSGDKNAARDVVKKYKEDRGSMTVEERIQFLREAIKNVTHLVRLC